MMQPANRFTAARWLTLSALAKGDPTAMMACAEGLGANWIDRRELIGATKAAVGASDSGDFATAFEPVADSFLSDVRPLSVALRLEALRRVPVNTSIIVSGGGVAGAVVGEGGPAPVLQGNFASQAIRPSTKVAGVIVTTHELLRHGTPEAQRALVADLADATAVALDRAFLWPGTSGSVLSGASTFAATGSTVAAVDADLRNLVSRVPGSFRGAFAMSPNTAAYLGTLRSGDGAPAYPNIGPAGGTLMGLPVYTSTVMEEDASPPTRVIALLDPASILFGQGPVELSTSDQATLQMLDNPTNATSTGTATTMVSMWQANSVALLASIAFGLYARSGSAAYYTAGF